MTTDALEGRDLKAVVRNRPSCDHPVWTEPYPRRVRTVLDGVAVVDSKALQGVVGSGRRTAQAGC
jgi:hypothetical protein